MPALGQNFCSYLLKGLAVAFALIGIIFTAESGKGCDFIMVEDTDGDQLDLIRTGDRPDFVFGTATKMRVGIYQYQILEGSNVQGCVDYPQKFFDIEGYPSLTSAQICSVMAPIICAIAIVCTLIDFCICTFRGSNVCGGFFYVVAMAVQCGVFGIIADPVFCFEDSELECTLGSEMYLCIAAVIFYFLASCFSCCAPHSDPIYKNFTRKNKDNDADGVVQNTTTTTTTVKRATVVLNNDSPGVGPGVGSVVSPGGRRKSRPGGQDEPDTKYDKHGNRVFY
eukprot:CAMPEP_0113618460 /NCGR_PEP_ID=MMETSP0017_2-20120614/9349_1 /TAXON_ID=2856 /ORGANISM="Cylindrotheca closterium" /LENGTH=280 /DNA_ID=CAMNT_0000527971 /DNA_START=71 /DNA_END=913 /DNA_ORIENTATION=- /assembly_acc=CAM_ASM_000147